MSDCETEMPLKLEETADGDSLNETPGEKKSVSKSNKRTWNNSDESENEADDRLEDEDYDLLEENLGMRFKKKFRRIKTVSSDSEDDDAQKRGERIGKELFDSSDTHHDDDTPKRVEKRDRIVNLDSSSSDDESDIDNFIVDDDGVPISTKSRAIVTNPALQAARDIFGTEFDFKEFKQYDDSKQKTDENELISQRRWVNEQNLSDRTVTDATSRVKIRQPIHCRIKKLVVDEFYVELTSKTSDLLNENGQFNLSKDEYYDKGKEKLIREKYSHESILKKKYDKYAIVHPSFFNGTHQDCKAKLERMDTGDALIHPSSKGCSFLTLSIKHDDNVIQNVEIRDKIVALKVSDTGRFLIGSDTYEDLDEIFARFVNPISGNMRDIVAHKNYHDAKGGIRAVAYDILRKKKAERPAYLPYILSLTKELPGKAMLSYMVRNGAIHEFITVLPEGFRFRYRIHNDLNVLILWFKDHYMEAIPILNREDRGPTAAS